MKATAANALIMVEATGTDLANLPFDLQQRHFIQRPLTLSHTLWYAT